MERVSHDEMLSLFEDLTEALETARNDFDLAFLLQAYKDNLHCGRYHDGWHDLRHPFSPGNWIWSWVLVLLDPMFYANNNYSLEKTRATGDLAEGFCYYLWETRQVDELLCFLDVAKCAALAMQAIGFRYPVVYNLLSFRQNREQILQILLGC